MKYLVLNEDKMWFYKNLKGELDLIDASAIKAEASDAICTLCNGELVKVVVINVLPPNLIALDISNKGQLSGNAFWVVKTYFLKSILANIANAMQGNSQQTMFKILGMIEPVFMGRVP